MKINFSIIYYLFIILISLLLIEGIYSGFYYKVSAIIDLIPFKSISSINPYIWNENGLIEILQNIILLFSIFYFLRFLKYSNYKSEDIFYILLLYSYFFGLIYYFFEEISWGQHFLKWDSPEFFLEFNNQKETNLHNISNLFNELPRTFLLIWCSFSFLIFQILNKKIKNNSVRYFIYPNDNLKKISLLLIFFVTPDIFVDKLNLHPGYPTDFTTHIRFYEVIDFITFNYIRLSELHELIFDYYILAHSYYLNKNIKLINKQIFIND